MSISGEIELYKFAAVRVILSEEKSYLNQYKLKQAEIFFADSCTHVKDNTKE
jgi:hypothetical protein